MDKHLSIFTPFSEKGRENNLTRALIIILQREPLFFNMLFKKITGQDLDVNLLKEEIEFDTQKPSKLFELEDTEKIYGVALNTVKYRENLREVIGAEDPITDISIQIGNILIIIEVKPHGEDPRIQLNNQISKLNYEKLEWEFRSLTWFELIEYTISLESYRENLKIPNIILSEFNSFIRFNYPELLPTSKIDNSLSAEIIERRITQIEKDINVIIHGNDFEEENQFIKLKECNFAERFKLYFKEENGSKKILLSVWPGDTKRQGSFLYKNNFSLKAIEDSLKNNLGIEEIVFDKNYKVFIRPYIRFSHIMGRGIFWEDISLENDLVEIHNKISGTFKKSEDEKLKNLKEEISKFVNDKEKFLEKFREKFENTNRSYVGIHVGSEITLSFDINYIEKVEKKEQTAVFFKKVIDRVLEIIENKKTLIIEK